MDKIISGIQQIGIGVPNVRKIWKWYRRILGIDVRVFEEDAEAPLMTRYTGGEVHSRRATLAVSMEGGGGMEMWEFTSRDTEKAAFPIQLGDYGLYACRIKSRNVEASYHFHRSKGITILGELYQTPSGKPHYFMQDVNGNIFNIVEGEGWFLNTGHPSRIGGIAGCMIGVSDIDRSLKLYRDVLEYETTVYDETGHFDDLKELPSGDQSFRRVLLKHSAERKGPFSKLLGPTQIELIQPLERAGKRIFENRYWGDWGFIHLCFDIRGMDQLKEECQEAGFPFTIDSGATFDMGEAGGRFAYIEDPDGTWIEFVETHKVPVIKQMGWYIYLKDRDPEKPLPNFLLKAMQVNRVK